MTSFTVSLTGLNIGVRAIRAATKSFCREFLAEGEPAFSVAVEEADIDYERSVSEGMRAASYLETLALLRKISDHLIRPFSWFRDCRKPKSIHLYCPFRNGEDHSYPALAGCGPGSICAER